ncbi:C45 family autoproteolytic acyltransferase/hydolase [Tenacibaculum halocynthiae]|uniref:C45 family autoproteolytic acyltransferase/hydolase n=1 Tax=Tenacibaculum halocynthiae TaxID=1254437 RepID=UPI0038934B7C
MCKRRYTYILIALIALVFSSCGISKSLHDIPDISHYKTTIEKRNKISDTVFNIGANFISKNEEGLWELYVSGNPLEIGLKTGSLTQELFHKQEDAFLSKVKKIVPSKFKQFLLRKFLAWFNRKMYLHISEEYKTEIYGLSKYASPKYNSIANEYLRILYLHGAHDIGHALKDLALVGCSSFAVWGDKTVDGKLVLGRNFDFYAGDDFAKEKIIAFVNPTNGHKFMSVTWAGMIGVMSGMNEHGLTVTINAGKSKMPLVAKTPISIVTREILQYASTIDEAIEIAKKREVFVSESILVGSAKDNKAVTIEVSPSNFGVYDVENTSQLICSNHFQSEAYKNDKKNTKHIEESHSKYRYLKMQELIGATKKVTPKDAVDILRNKEGLKGKEIGFGNEKALNQLLAHHGIVFKPSERLVWVSTNPYQLGKFVAYDLNEIFNNENKKANYSLSKKELLIKEDDFLYSQAYKNYEIYRKQEKEIELLLKNKQNINSTLLKSYIENNESFWKVYYLVGKYYYSKKYYRASLTMFLKAKEKEVTTYQDKKSIESYIRKLKRKLKK